MKNSATNYYKHYDIGKLLKYILLLVVCIILLGALSFHLTEGWSYFDSLYFTVVTFSTIGYGDIIPSTIFGKVLVMVYAFLGVPLFVAITSLVMERRFKQFVFHHFAHHSRKLKETEKEIKKEEIKNIEQEKEIKKLKKEVKEEPSHKGVIGLGAFFGKK